MMVEQTAYEKAYEEGFAAGTAAQQVLVERLKTINQRDADKILRLTHLITELNTVRQLKVEHDADKQVMVAFALDALVNALDEDVCLSDHACGADGTPCNGTPR